MRGKSTFIGRHDERAALSGLLARAAAGRGGSVAVLGEAGMGKSALVDHMVGARPAGMSVLRVTGVEVESDLAYAALATLMSQAGSALRDLDDRNAGALHGAIGIGDATPPGLGVHMATLALVTFLAARGPVLLVVDDVQWIDAASLGLVTFVARRVAHDAVAVVLVGRPAGDLEPMLAGIDRLTLGPLSADEAVVLMAAHDVVAPVAAECWRATGGNPLALVELAAALGPCSDSRSVEIPMRASESSRTFMANTPSNSFPSVRSICMISSGRATNAPSPFSNVGRPRPAAISTTISRCGLLSGSWGSVPAAISSASLTPSRSESTAPQAT